MNLQPHQQRVVNERDELQTKLKALTTFIDLNATFNTLTKTEQDLLQKQEVIMRQYVSILTQRIDRFLPEDDFPLGKACDLSGEGTCESCQ